MCFALVAVVVASEEMAETKAALPLVYGSWPYAQPLAYHTPLTYLQVRSYMIKIK